MAVRVKPFEKNFKIIVDASLSPQARSQRIAAFASARIAEIDAQDASVFGAVPPRTVSVDGRQGAALESVNPDHGIIVAEWQLVTDVLQWIADTLRSRSPVVSGKYRDSHTMLADGAASDPFAAPTASEFLFYNPLPYSRKIEIGKTEAGRDFVIQVENRIYERTANDAQARFGNLAKIRFTYTSSGLSKPDRVPAITVTLR